MNMSAGRGPSVPVTLLLTPQKPFRPASNATIGRWIRAFLKESGVPDLFTAHSLRHAATSAAARKGVAMDVIRRAAGWSPSSKVFFQHYNLPLRTDQHSFSAAVLSDQG